MYVMICFHFFVTNPSNTITNECNGYVIVISGIRLIYNIFILSELLGDLVLTIGSYVYGTEMVILMILHFTFN